MTLTASQHVIQASGPMDVDDAETLLGALLEHPEAGIDLAECTHLHAACLQVLLVARRSILRWPADAAFAQWIGIVLNTDALPEPPRPVGKV